MQRCAWAGTAEAMVRYHDEEWGAPTRNDAELFELLTLEGAQAGLSWSTILNKREGYRQAFAGFDVERVARFGAKDIERLLADASIVRNRLKVESTIANAQAILDLDELPLRACSGPSSTTRRSSTASRPCPTSPPRPRPPRR